MRLIGLLLLCLTTLAISQAYDWQEGNDGQVTWASGCDFQGNDITDQPSSDSQCGSLCIANSQCNYFSWGNDVCYMKYSSNNLVATDWEGGMCGCVNSRINNPPPPSGNLFICYFPNWARYRANGGAYTVANLNPRTCTHIMYAFASIQGNSMVVSDYEADIVQGGYAQFVGLKSQNSNLKAMISLGGGGADGFSAVASSSESIAAFTSSVVSFLQQYQFDGVDVDWEVPSMIEKTGFSNLLIALRQAFGSRYLLTIAAAAIPPNQDAGYDYGVLSQNLDFLNLMTYDFNGWPWAKSTGNNAPLNDGSSNNIVASIDFWRNQGFPVSKIILGIPTYGRSWTLSTSNAGYNAPASGPGAAGYATGEAGVLTYYEICLAIQNNGWTKVSATPDNGPYAYSAAEPGATWTGYDDVTSTLTKLDFIKSQGMGGAMVWDVSMDDFGNYCGDGYNPLMTTISQSLGISL